MSFTKNEKLKALAIVNIFETSRPFGDYAACVVLNDSAGVSYGINQFTHRSGSLAAVVEAYLNNGGVVGKAVLESSLPQLKRKSAAAIQNLSSDTRFKNALRAAAITSEMKAAQQEVAFEKYLRPALEICDVHNFVLPLSLAVVYDSLNHGSWEKISRNVGFPACDEKKWVLEYIRCRHSWLSNNPRLKPTSYRTQFFLEQIAIGNWDLRLPITVHGFRLTEALLPTEARPEEAMGPVTESEPGAIATGSGAEHESVLTVTNNAISSAAENFARVDNVVTTVTSRKDAAKSLWTTVIGTIWQAVWAVFGFFAGLPKEVWIVVAMIAAALMLVYLYRQIELGRIREKKLITDN